MKTVFLCNCKHLFFT